MLFKTIFLLNLNKIKKFNNTRFYHTDNVFGFKYHKLKNEFEVSKDVINARINNSNLHRLISAYRQYGHTQANINSIALTNVNNTIIKELNPKRYGFSLDDFVCTKNLLYATNVENNVKISNVIQYLENVYCKHISAEFMHLETEEEIEWFAEQMEKRPLNQINDENKLHILKQLLISQVLENFLQTKFASFKRYGGEGAESMIAFFYEFLQLCSKTDVEDIVLAMPHRGRLSLLTGLLEMPVEKIFRKLRGLPDFPEHFKCTGDVISHLITSVDLSINNKNVHVTMLYNPSHLEAVNPVSMGKTRSKQLTVCEGGYGNGNGKFSDRVLNVQVHGDAAYVGQGIDQECLVLAQVPHFEIGGTIHLVVNNQIGFTTPPDRGRSMKYCTDLAKIISAPVIHVNGLYPEEIVKVTRIAFEYQRKFRKDVFIDMNCYRKWGHNELDDPTFTNPIQYHLIRSIDTVPNLYAKQLKSEGLINDLEIEKIITDRSAYLNESLKSVEKYVPEDPCFERQWKGFSQAPASISTWDTGVSLDILKYVGFRSVNYPIKFNMHPHLVKTHVSSRITKLVEGQNIDWSTAETLAFGSLLYQGHNIRISGQDVGRGTFSHRHAMFVDQQTNEIYIPLNELEMKGQGFLEIANSILSEEAVLGYEYGMSIDNPNNLIIWEAQFGDFFNGAQIIIDTFVTSGELKWLTSSGLVILLPHGYDGAGPEHSSSRMERFLQLTDSSEISPDGDDVNIHVVNPTTPAQYFHLLRRQIIPNYRKPLIVIAPKILLRLSNATSSLMEMGPGYSFQPVLDDPFANPAYVKKVILVSGKHYYELNKERFMRQLNNVAIIRLESLCPFPIYHLQLVLEKYINAKTYIWSQEEHRNMGAWTFVKPRFENMVGRPLKYTGRDVAGTVAVGVSNLHNLQAKQVIQKPFDIIS